MNKKSKFFVFFFVLFLRVFLGLLTAGTSHCVRKFLKQNTDVSMSLLDSDFAEAKNITDRSWIGKRFTCWVEGTKQVMRLKLFTVGAEKEKSISMYPDQAQAVMEYYKNTASHIEVDT